MAKVQKHVDVSGAGAPDSPRDGPLERLVHSRWLAMFVVAFAVSWGFHQVEKLNDRKIERNQRVMECTVTGVSKAQDSKSQVRVQVGPILEDCKKQARKN